MRFQHAIESIEKNTDTDNATSYEDSNPNLKVCHIISSSFYPIPRVSYLIRNQDHTLVFHASLNRIS